MEDEDKRNQELFIVGQAFLHTGICEVEDIIENYIDYSKKYQDSYTVALLNLIKKDISKIKDKAEKDREEALKPREGYIYAYQGKIIKIYDKTLQCGFCIKKDYINNEIVQKQGICLDFQNNQILDINSKQLDEIEEVYCDENNELYQLSIKEFSNRDYGKLLYDNIKKSFLVIKKEEVVER